MAAFFAPAVILMRAVGGPDRLDNLSGPILVGLMLSGFLGGWLSWSILVPRWRLWAYRRVDNLSALKALAVQRSLIWPEGHIFERTEIRPRWLRGELAGLEASRAR
jgi:hypothetical protein